MNKKFSAQSLKDLPFFQFGKNPARDWKTLLFACVLVTLALLSFASYLYEGISRGDIFQVAEKGLPAADSLNRDLLSKTIGAYDTHARTLEKLKASPPRLVDPSR